MKAWRSYSIKAEGANRYGSFAPAHKTLR